MDSGAPVLVANLSVLDTPQWSKLYFFFFFLCIIASVFHGPSALLGVIRT